MEERFHKGYMNVISGHERAHDYQPLALSYGIFLTNSDVFINIFPKHFFLFPRVASSLLEVTLKVKAA